MAVFMADAVETRIILDERKVEELQAKLAEMTQLSGRHETHFDDLEGSHVTLDFVA